MHTFDDYELGRTDDTVRIENREENVHAITKMASQCRYTIEIISRELEPAIFDTVEFVEAAKRLALGNKRARVRMLVFEPVKIVRRGHRLITLATSLSSFLESRVPSQEHKSFNETMFIADATGYLHRLDTDRFEGAVNFNDRRASKHLLAKFDGMWARAKPDMNLRRMTL